MNTHEAMIEKFTRLAHMDIDAFHAYGHALKHIDHPTVHEQILSFQEDHARHVRTLATEIRNLGGEPPEFSPDFKGFLLSGFTAIRSATGTEGALKAMRGNEILTNKLYDEALHWDLPEDKRRIIQAHDGDEKRHLNYIEQTLESRLWEIQPRAR